MNGRKVRWTRRTLRRLDQIATYVSNDDPLAARDVVHCIVSATEALGTQPAMGRVGRIGGTRELILADIDHIVAHRVLPNEIDVLTIMHTRQKWPEAL